MDENKTIGYVMKKLLIGVLVLSFNVSTFANANESNGFRKIKWEESITRYKNVMHLTSDEGKPRKFYVIKNNEMSFGEITLTSIIYVFYKGKFSSVIIQTDQSVTNLSQALSQLKKKFGKPFYANKYTNKYRWKDRTTAIQLKCYSSSHKCSIIYNSVAMSNLKKTDSEASAKNTRN